MNFEGVFPVHCLDKDNYFVVRQMLLGMESNVVHHNMHILQAAFEPIPFGMKAELQVRG